jgi:dihydroorotase-like cyclic amidohydrolase
MKDRSSIFDCSSGAPGVETLLPVLFSEGVLKGKISVPLLARLLAENPAKIFGLFPKKGTLVPGSDADIVILDPGKKWIVKGEGLRSNAGWTPYEGMEVTGKVETTIVRGKIIFEEGNVIGEKGYGRFLQPL